MKQAIVLLMLLAFTNVTEKPVPTKAVERSRKAADVLESAMAQPEARIPKALLSKAMAVAVMITEVKTVGLLINGVGQGYGVVTRRLPNGNWSQAGYIHMLLCKSDVLQLHVREFNVILLFMNDKSADRFLEKAGFMFDREKAPVAGPIGEIKIEEKEVVPVAGVFSYVSMTVACKASTSKIHSRM